MAKPSNPYTDNSFVSSDLKTILHSKRANIYYLSHCRVMQKDGRILYLTEDDKANLFYNIPIANTPLFYLARALPLPKQQCVFYHKLGFWWAFAVAEVRRYLWDLSAKSSSSG